MKLKPIGAAIAAALAVGVLAGCTTTPAEPEMTTLRIASSGPLGGFDVFAGGGYGFQAVYDQLVHLYASDDPTVIGQPRGWLIESWEYSDDRTVITMNVREGVDFTDGEHLDAEAVKANLEPRIGQFWYTKVEEYVVTGEYTLEVHLSEPDEGFLRGGLNISVASPAALDDLESLVDNPVGSGPYLLESGDGDTGYTFVRNPDYWNPDAYDFDRLELIVMPDLTARLNALKSGQVDYADINIATAAEAEAAGLETYVITPQYSGLLIGDRDGEIVPALADVRVRNAIQMAFDRETYNDTVLAGLGSTSNQLGTEDQAGSGYYLPELADMFPYDPDRARELLAEAGYPDGFVIPPVDAAGWVSEALLTYMTQALADIGITVTFETGNPDYFTDFLTGEFAVFPMSGNWDEHAWYSLDGFGNPWKNTDAETAELLATLNIAEGDEWLEAQSRLTEKTLEEGWVAILAHEPIVWAHDARLKVADVYPWPDFLGAIQRD